MKKINLSLISLCILFLTVACTNQTAYRIVQDNVQNEECHNLPTPSAYDECIAKRSKPYGDYKENRQEVLKKDD
jgi:hypothetical protein